MQQGEGRIETGPRGRILLVDDDLQLLNALKRVLTHARLDVTTATTGAEAIELLRDRPPFDAIVSDISMPGINGLRLLQKVHERDLGVPVVLLTGSPALDTAMEAVEHGAFRYLVKPVAASRLVEVVVRATQLRALARLKHEAPQIIDVGRQPRGERAALAVRFDNALAKLWTAFQPIVRWSDRRVYGYEALVRSGEPSLASAPDLLDVAEQLGRLHDLGRAVRAYVSRCAHQAPGNALIFVNLRPADLTDPELPAAAAPLSAMAERVVLEVTERESLEQVAGVTSHVAALRRLGYRLAVDDLGAGYAGLTAVTQLAPDFVKLDKELVHGLDRLPRKRSVVRAMLRLCGGDLGIRVVSEGIETTGERDVITAEGGDLLQGYLFARPGPGFGGASWT